MFETKKKIIISAAIIGAIVTTLIVYFILMITGAINLLQSNLVFTSGSKEIEYSSNIVVTCHETTLESGSLRSGHYYEITYLSSLSTVGEIDNEFVVTIYDRNKNIVTSKYEITYVPGKLKMNGVPIKVQTDGATQVYDGTPLTSDSWSLVSGNLLDGHFIEVNVTGTIINAGTCANDFWYTIYDSNNNNVSYLYEVEKELGTLVVDPITLTVSTSGVSKTYDATPLTSEAFTVLSSLLDTHSFHGVTTGSITEVGTTENSIVWYVYDSNGTDISTNYKLNLIAGELKITQRIAGVYTDTQSKEYDGEALVTNKVAVENLLEGHSYEVIHPSSITYVTEITNSVSIKIVDANNQDVTAYYDFAEYFGYLIITAKYIRITTGDAQKIYDFADLYNTDYVLHDTLLDSHELSILSFTKISNPSSVENNITFDILDSDKKSIAFNYEIEVIPGTLNVYKKDITITTLSFNTVYTGEEISFSNNHPVYSGMYHSFEYSFEPVVDAGTYDNTIVIKFDDSDASNYYNITFETGSIYVAKQAIYIQTSSSDKLYNGEGFTSPTATITSKYLNEDVTIEYSDDILEISNFISVTELGIYYNTADVVLKDTTNYELVVIWGGITIWDESKDLIVITPQDILTGVTGGTVDASTFYQTNANLKGLGALTAKGYTYYAVISGSISSVGYVSTYIEDFKLYNETGDLVAYLDTDTGQIVSTEYVVQINTGLLVMTDVTIEFSSEVVEKTYDGETLYCDNVIVTPIEGSLPEGYTYEIIGEITNVGSIQPVVRILDEELNDVTKYYNIINNLGKLIVKEAEINFTFEEIVTTPNANLSEISVGSYTVTHYSVIGSVVITLNGYSGESYSYMDMNQTNTTIEIFDENGVDISSNFKISISGRITVN